MIFMTTSCFYLYGQNNSVCFITGRNEVVAKVMFLHVCVILFRPVRILLECILVFTYSNTARTVFFLFSLQSGVSRNKESHKVVKNRPSLGSQGLMLFQINTFTEHRDQQQEPKILQEKATCHFMSKLDRFAIS